MTRHLFRSLAAVLAAAGVATAQQPAPAVQPAPAQPGTAVQPGGTVAAYRAKDIIGTKVAVQSNTGVGTVDDIVFSAGGDVEYLIVATQDGKLTTVPWAAATFNPAQKTAVLDIPVQRWQSMPTYTSQAYPQFFTPAYRTEVYRAYNLTPGELRRVERRLGRP
jgi:hypothetical protein